MAGRTFEIAHWTPTETYLNDPTSVEPVLDLLRKSVPQEYIYSGLQIEKPVAHLFIGWESLEAHEAARASPTNAAAGALFAPIVVQGTLSHVHAKFVSDPAPALRAPVTEVAWFTLKEGVDKAKAIEVFKELSEVNAEEAAKPDRRTLGATWGEVVEKPGQFLLVVGYESPETHMKYVTTDAKMGRLLQTVIGLTDIEYGHVKLVSAAKSPSNRL